MIECGSCKKFTEYGGPTTICQYCGATNLTSEEAAQQCIVLSTTTLESLINLHELVEELKMLEDYALVDELSAISYTNNISLPRLDKIIRYFNSQGDITPSQRKELENVYMLLYMGYFVEE